MARPDPVILAARLRSEIAPVDQPLDVFAVLRARTDIAFVRRFGANPQIDGVYVRNAADRLGFIYINRGKPMGRQRFTAAHELGHHLLEHVEELDVDVFAQQQSQEERDANYFAAEFLIPKSGVMKFVLREKIDATRLEGATAVAQQFKVSLQPALIQLRAVNLLEGRDMGRLLSEADTSARKPLAEYEHLAASDRSELPSRFVEAVVASYHSGRLTAEAAGDALDLSAETVKDRYGVPAGAVRGSDDLSDLM